MEQKNSLTISRKLRKLYRWSWFWRMNWHSHQVDNGEKGTQQKKQQVHQDTWAPLYAAWHLQEFASVWHCIGLIFKGRIIDISLERKAEDELIKDSVLCVVTLQLLSPVSGSQPVVPGPAAPAAPRNPSATQTLGKRPRIRTSGIGPVFCALTSPLVIPKHAQVWESLLQNLGEPLKRF